MGMNIVSLGFVGGILSSLIQPANNGFKVPDVSLSGSYVAPVTTVHPFLLGNRAQYVQFLTEAYATKTGIGSGRYVALQRLQANVVALLASSNSATLTSLENPTAEFTGPNDADQYAWGIFFSVQNPNPTVNAGAAGWAVDLAFYSYMVNLAATALPGTNTGTIGTGSAAGLAATAKTAANTILYNWAAMGLKTQAGDIVQDYSQITQENCTAVTTNTSVTPNTTSSKTTYGVTPTPYGVTNTTDSNGYPVATTCSEAAATSTTEQGIQLQEGRGLREYIEAADFLNDGTMTDPQLVLGFINNFKNMMLTATNFKYANTNSFRCGRYDNQASNDEATLTLAASYTGDADLMKNMAGDPTSSHRVWNSWPEQVEGTIYGNNDSGFTCLAQKNSLGTIINNPLQAYVAPGEMGDRFRLPANDDFGYPMGSMQSLQIAARQLANAGYSPYTFVAANGASLQLAIDYYSQWVVKYITLGISFTIPTTSTPTILDEPFYFGSTFTGTATGSAVMGADGRTDFDVIGAMEYPNDTGITAAINATMALGTTAYVPFGELGLEVLMQMN